MRRGGEYGKIAILADDGCQIPGVQEKMKEYLLHHNNHYGKVKVI